MLPLLKNHNVKKTLQRIIANYEICTIVILRRVIPYYVPVVLPSIGRI